MYVVYVYDDSMRYELPKTYAAAATLLWLTVVSREWMSLPTDQGILSDAKQLHRTLPLPGQRHSASGQRQGSPDRDPLSEQFRIDPMHST